jgi:hypothetical protein
MNVDPDLELETRKVEFEQCGGRDASSTKRILSGTSSRFSKCHGTYYFFFFTLGDAKTLEMLHQASVDTGPLSRAERLVRYEGVFG